MVSPPLLWEWGAADERNIWNRGDAAKVDRRVRREHHLHRTKSNCFAVLAFWLGRRRPVLSFGLMSVMAASRERFLRSKFSEQDAKRRRFQIFRFGTDRWIRTCGRKMHIHPTYILILREDAVGSCGGYIRLFILVYRLFNYPSPGDVAPITCFDRRVVGGRESRKR